MMKRRIIEGMGANAFSMGINTAIQLVSLPLFLYFWNLETYGKWLLLSAIPSYLSMVDLGMVTAAGNKMTMAMGRNDACEANRIFQSAQAFTVIIFIVLALLIIPTAFFAPFPWFENIDQRIALAALSLSVLLGLFSGLSDAVFKASGRYALGTMLGNSVRVSEWLGGILGLVLIGSFVSVAIGGLIMRLLSSILLVMWAKKTIHVLHWGLKLAQLSEIRAMFKPAISFMAFPLADALSFQGITILVGAILGPISVALFSAHRTIARVLVQMTSILSYVLGPEFSMLFGQANNQAIKTLYLRTSLLGALQAILLSVLLYFISPWLLQIWTHDEIHFESGLMLLMLAYAAISGVWHIPRALLMATNQHVKLSFWVLFLACLRIAFSWGLSQFYGLIGIVVALVLCEVMVAFICINLANQFVYGDKKQEKNLHENRSY
jgi:O-antigen/teichoic acid export membrane protein